MSDGNWLTDAVSEGLESVREYTSFLGIQRERYVCPECNVACVESHTHNPQTAAFDGGACPSWECPECQSHFVRETSDESHTMDLYGRDN